MARFKELLTNSWAAISDPNQKDRISNVVSAIEHAFKQQREKFDLQLAIRGLDYRDSDLEAAKSIYYKSLLKRYWLDGPPKDVGMRVLTLVAGKLGIGDLVTQRLNEEIGLEYLGVKIASFLQDGVITQTELAELNAVGGFLRKDFRWLVQQNSKQEILAILRGVFSEATWSGRLEPAFWANLKLSATTLGLTEVDLVAAVSLQARNYAEHVLADAKSDGLISDNEDRYLAWLVQTFHFDAPFIAYLSSEVTFLKEREQVGRGNLSPIPIPLGANLRSGEILYLVALCTFRQTKIRQGTAAYEDHSGHILLTDNRIVFQSTTKPIAVLYRSILHWRVGASHLQISVANKPELNFYVASNTDRLFPEKVTSLIRLHSQTLVRKAEGVADRHIPRDVRQRVWQRYGGRCAECGATDYLEFDHIVPVNRGGSNSDNNVQLLCRKCNLAKSDHI